MFVETTPDNYTLFVRNRDINFIRFNRLFMSFKPNVRVDLQPGKKQRKVDVYLLINIPFFVRFFDFLMYIYITMKS